GIDWTIADTGWAKASYGKLYGQWLCGTCVFVYDYNRFNSDSVLNMLSKYKITNFCAPPTVYRYFISEDLSEYDFSSVLNASSVGEPLHPDVFRKFREMTGIEIHEALGQTESACIVGNFTGIEIKPGSMGKANPLYKVFILNNENKLARCGEEGKVAVYLGDTVSSDDCYPCHKYSQYPIGLFQGYIYDKEKNSKIYVNDFYLTGDVAKKDEEGYYWFVSRDDDVIKTSGYRVGPFEIESVLMAHPSVKECAVVGEPDFARGQIVKAFVVLNEGFEPAGELSDELVEFVKQNTAPYKYPRKLEFINELPKNNNGKINRTLLKKGSV
ncbi:MAG: AMP-binding protein, partial [Armatimonadetes bacterium]|nr:AMP-binding protein [Candidatus Hippobium faecium]